MSILNFIVGVATGIISGFGIGGGSILVLYLTAVMGMQQEAAGHINLLYFIGCAPIALIGHIRNRYVEWRVMLWCALAGVLVAVPISFLAKNLNNEWLRRLFGIVLLCVAVKELRTGRKNSK